MSSCKYCGMKVQNSNWCGSKACIKMWLRYMQRQIKEAYSRLNR